MSNILKFPNTDGVIPIPSAIDKVLRSMGIPQKIREDAVTWVAEVDKQLRIPDFALSVDLPDGLTPEQTEHIRREIHREFSRYGAEIYSAKCLYILTSVKKRLGLVA